MRQGGKEAEREKLGETQRGFPQTPSKVASRKQRGISASFRLRAVVLAERAAGSAARILRYQYMGGACARIGFRLP